jgi:hypothetical protein
MRANETVPSKQEVAPHLCTSGEWVQTLGQRKDLQKALRRREHASTQETDVLQPMAFNTYLRQSRQDPTVYDIRTNSPAEDIGQVLLPIKDQIKKTQVYMWSSMEITRLHKAGK